MEADSMEGFVFRVTYEDDRQAIKWKWIVFKEKDNSLLWFYNPLHEMRIESVPLGKILRLEQQEFSDLAEFLTAKKINPELVRIKILEMTEKGE